MHTRYLVMWLEGPLQSYGGKDQIFVRGTQKFPSRSAICGMLFSAAGWHDEQRERLAELRECSLAVYGYKGESPVLSDYQIIGGGWDLKDPWQERMVPHKSNGKPVAGALPTRPVIKQYLQDSVFAAILEFPAQWENDVRAACCSPHDILFLGRKACVPTIPILQGVAGSFEEALAILDRVEEKRNEICAVPAVRHRVYEETQEAASARWHLRDVPLAFQPAFEYGWRYVAARAIKQPSPA